MGGSIFVRKRINGKLCDFHKVTEISISSRIPLWPVVVVECLIDGSPFEALYWPEEGDSRKKIGVGAYRCIQHESSDPQENHLLKITHFREAIVLLGLNPSILESNVPDLEDFFDFLWTMEDVCIRYLETLDIKAVLRSYR